jgi:exopolyphosphatase/guanosine-5'-triphosphate,3'-diphosphate pyrophosphatase
MGTLLEEVLALRARYDEEPSHSDHVAKLALQIFDGLQSWHGYKKRSRELLHSAALLHDIGWSQTPDGKGHHKWSAKLIRDYTWEHLDRDEVEIVAQVARYHRKAIPEKDHLEFHALPEDRQKKVMVLGGILRQADALDRTHTARITCATAEVRKDAVVIVVTPSGPWEPEKAMFGDKREMLQRAVGRPVRVEAAA